MTRFTPAAVHNPIIAVTAARRPFHLLSNRFILIVTQFQLNDLIYMLIDTIQTSHKSVNVLVLQSKILLVCVGL